MRQTTRGVGAALVFVLLATSAHAYFLDSERRFDVRMRAYTQWSILTQSSDTTHFQGNNLNPASPRPPSYSAGDLAQIRNFYNPEFDATLTDFTGWMGGIAGLRFLRPDEFKFRFAWWGFYDAVYDAQWANAPWNDNVRNLQGRFSQSDHPRRESFHFNDEYKDPRAIYGHRNRINELYIDYSNGPVFLRVGRQAISWGESDTIALIDNQNPYDLTLGAPGFFQDLDESRIPLWTLRGTFKLVDNWKWLSSFFLDAYLVPGIIDTTVSINPITGGVSAFGPDVADPQRLIPTGGIFPSLHAVTVDHLPRNTWDNSRLGVRLTGVLFRDYTVQAFYYRTFNQAPVPLLVTPGALERAQSGLTQTLVDSKGRRVSSCKGRPQPCGLAYPAVTILQRQIYDVWALAATWYSDMLKGIVRTQVNYFKDEPAFLPKRNLNPQSQLPVAGRPNTSVPTANYLRWVLGYDRFFFFRPLNPSNSFTLIGAYTGSFNLDETGKKNFRNYSPKAGRPATRLTKGGILPGLVPVVRPKDYEDQYQYESFFQFALQTDYLHGKLEPRLVTILDPSGIFAFQAGFTYRITDSFLAGVTYLAIESGGRKAGIATFRNHDMVQFRLTAQLN
jgi:Protein of unknown function (DUF1302)